MRFQAVAILTGATAVAANSATLLLPGFQGRDLQASVVASAGDATTYLVTCPTSVASSACGIPDSGLTEIASPTSVILQDVSAGTTAIISCNVEGTTSALCHASQGTIDVTHTLASSDMNWMAVTITGPVSTSTPTPTPTLTPTNSLVSSTPTPTPTSIPASSSSSPIPSSTFTPASSPKKSSTLRVATSTPLKVVSIPTAAADSVAPSAAAASATASGTPISANAAVSLTGNAWAFGAAAVALAYALV
ncbi:hypothetical protein N7495_004620 [Penicillium taxi]|uniref:uncharacterized protein n=1 Tax=Penicillium taxi TaxID=168475 RepID=UPI002544E55C|nr:uncharacterized protein N7495_004620 [Penicillium taxi]KAJ5899876.1 hypothetical protein N7495_004620 [Penicillium taxi]